MHMSRDALSFSRVSGLRHRESGGTRATTLAELAGTAPRADAGATRATDGEAANSDRSDGSGTVVSNRRFTCAVTTLWVSNTRTLRKWTRFRP
jgi:hypothetical protein